MNKVILNGLLLFYVLPFGDLNADNFIFQKGEGYKILLLPPKQTNVRGKLGRRFQVPVTGRKVAVDPIEVDCKSKTFKTEADRLRKLTRCKPREVMIDVEPTQLGAWTIPNVIAVKKCGGSCSKTSKCIATETRNVTFHLRVMDKQIYCSSVEITEDVKCKCGCPQKNTDCKENQKLDKASCKCLCINTEERLKCSRSREHYWDVKICSCKCNQQKTCTTGTEWSENYCRCVRR